MAGTRQTALDQAKAHIDSEVQNKIAQSDTNVNIYLGLLSELAERDITTGLLNSHQSWLQGNFFQFPDNTYITTLTVTDIEALQTHALLKRNELIAGKFTEHGKNLDLNNQPNVLLLSRLIEVDDLTEVRGYIVNHKAAFGLTAIDNDYFQDPNNFSNEHLTTAIQSIGKRYLLDAIDKINETTNVDRADELQAIWLSDDLRNHFNGKELTLTENTVHDAKASAITKRLIIATTPDPTNLDPNYLPSFKTLLKNIANSIDETALCCLINDNNNKLLLGLDVDVALTANDISVTQIQEIKKTAFSNYFAILTADIGHQNLNQTNQRLEAFQKLASAPNARDFANIFNLNKHLIAPRLDDIDATLIDLNRLISIAKNKLTDLIIEKIEHVDLNHRNIDYRERLQDLSGAVDDVNIKRALNKNAHEGFIPTNVTQLLETGALTRIKEAAANKLSLENVENNIKSLQVTDINLIRQVKASVGNLNNFREEIRNIGNGSGLTGNPVTDALLIPDALAPSIIKALDNKRVGLLVEQINAQDFDNTNSLYNLPISENTEKVAFINELIRQGLVNNTTDTTESNVITEKITEVKSAVIKRQSELIKNDATAKINALGILTNPTQKQLDSLVKIINAKDPAAIRSLLSSERTNLGLEATHNFNHLNDNDVNALKTKVAEKYDQYKPAYSFCKASELKFDAAHKTFLISLDAATVAAARTLILDHIQTLLPHITSIANISISDDEVKMIQGSAKDQIKRIDDGKKIISDTEMIKRYGKALDFNRKRGDYCKGIAGGEKVLIDIVKANAEMEKQLALCKLQLNAEKIYFKSDSKKATRTQLIDQYLNEIKDMRKDYRALAIDKVRNIAYSVVDEAKTVANQGDRTATIGQYLTDTTPQPYQNVNSVNILTQNANANANTTALLKNKDESVIAKIALTGITETPPGFLPSIRPTIKTDTPLSAVSETKIDNNQTSVTLHVIGSLTEFIDKIVKKDKAAGNQDGMDKLSRALVEQLTNNTSDRSAPVEINSEVDKRLAKHAHAVLQALGYEVDNVALGKSFKPSKKEVERHKAWEREYTGMNFSNREYRDIRVATHTTTQEVNNTTPIHRR